MDVQYLSQLFATTYNGNPNIQKAGELEIRKIGRQEGAVVAILSLIASNDIDLATRQAAVVYLKNHVYSSYGTDSEHIRADQTPIPASDREALKASLLPLLADSPSRSITLQLANILKNIAARDFPDQWPSLLNDVVAKLTSPVVGEVKAGCIATLEMFKAFRFRQQSNILPELIPRLLPILAEIASNLLSNLKPDDISQETPSMLHMIFKTYKTSIVLSLSKHQQSPESLVPWGRLLFQTITFQIPKDAVPEDEAERERSEWWKAKKWACGILGRLFHRYGNSSQLPSSLQADYGEFAKNFGQTFAPEIFKMYLHQVQLYVSGSTWLSKKCQYQIFTFFTECVKPKITWQLLKPHYENLVSEYVYPQLSFTPSRQELWESDPVEYVRNAIDEYEVYDSPVSAATTFLLSLASNRTKTTFIPILALIHRILQSKPPATPAQRFGGLNMTSALGSLIMHHPKFRTNMEQFLVDCVLPEFESPEPYLKAIACEVIGTMEKSGIEWQSEENLKKHFQAVASCLDATDLPVRVQAVLTLSEMISNHDLVREAVAPQVGIVIQTLLHLSEESDLDILNSCMETMVEQYPKQLQPVATELTARLCTAYARLAKEGMGGDDEGRTFDMDTLADAAAGEDKTFMAMGVAKTIGTIINAVDNSAEILAQVTEIIIPIVNLTLEKKIIDLYDNAYSLADSITYKSRAISPNMWRIFELTYERFKSDAVDFLEEMLPSLDNFISYGTEAFVSSPKYRQQILDMYVTAIKDEHLGESDAINGCKLIEAFLLNLRGQADETLQPILAVAIDVDEKAQTAHLKLSNMNVILNCIIYNASATFNIMETLRPGSTLAFLDKWFTAINAERGLPRVHDKRLSIVAICEILKMDPSAVTVPEPIRNGYPTIVAGALKTFKAYPKAITERKELEALYAEDDSDDEDYKTLNLEGEDDDVWDEDSAYIEMLANEGARIREKSEKQAAGEDVSDVSDDLDITEEFGWICPLDQVDPYSTFKDALTSLQMKSPEGYQAATTSLTPDQQAILMEVMNKSNGP